jgi:hypothetical protein
MGFSRRMLCLCSFGALGSVAIAATGFTALGGFNATVGNNAGTAGSGTLVLQEGVGSTDCISTGSGTTTSATVTAANDNSTCPASIFGGAGVDNLEPGGTPVSATVTLENLGSLGGSSLTLTPSSCTVSDNTSPAGTSNTYFGSDTSGFCGEVDVTIENDTGSAACVFPVSSSSACGAPSTAGNLANLSSATLPGIAAGATATYKITVALSSAATNADQGLLATVPLTWTLAQ